MPNPLAEYVQAPSPIWDFTDSRTHYDGLWGQGLWPPEGMRGLGQFNNVWRPFFSGDRGRWQAAAAMGMAGVNLYDQWDQFIVPGRGQWGMGDATPTPPAPPCFAGPVGPLAPGQTYCATGTVAPLITCDPTGGCVDQNGNPITASGMPIPTPTGLSTNTIIGLSAAAGLLLLILVMGSRR